MFFGVRLAVAPGMKVTLRGAGRQKTAEARPAPSAVFLHKLTAITNDFLR